MANGTDFIKFKKKVSLILRYVKNKAELFQTMEG